jgi:branched-chain amino acid transport system substrate-binding protein
VIFARILNRPLAVPQCVAETLKIGVIAPLTGPGAPWGLAGDQAAKILAADVNAEGGLDVGGKKYQIEVVSYDDQYKAAQAVAAYNRLVNQDDVKYMLIETSASTMALKDNLEADKVVAITSSYSPNVIDSRTRFLFRQYSDSADFAPGYIGWIKQHVKGLRIAMLNPNDETGWGHQKVTEKVYRDSGFDLQDQELYERSIKDFQPLLTKVLGARPDVIDLGSTSPATAGLIVRQARELGFKGQFVQTGGPGWAAAVKAAGKENAEGMINVLYADPNNPGWQRIVSEYRKAIGQDPNEIVVPIYDGLNVLLRAIQKAGDVNDTTKVAEAFGSVLPIKSLQGDEMTYGHQQIMTTNYIGVIKDGQPVVQGTVR